MNGTLKPAELSALFARASSEGWTGVLTLGQRRHVLVQGAPLRAEALQPLDGSTAWIFSERPELDGRVDARLVRGFASVALERLDAPAPAESPASSLPKLLDIESEFARRAGRDFYAFLGLDRSATSLAIEERALQLEEHFTRLKATLSGEQAAMAGRLVLGARITRMRLLDPSFRTTYDEALGAGTGMLL